MSIRHISMSIRHGKIVRNMQINCMFGNRQQFLIAKVTLIIKINKMKSWERNSLTFGVIFVLLSKMTRDFTQLLQATLGTHLVI